MFSAYAIRKMLPKLIAAVILIQISYSLVVFAINLSNDLGKGIGEIMAAPFGGDSINGIYSAIDNAGGGSKAVTFGLFVGIAVAAYINLGGLLFFALPVVLAILIGFFTLYLREILILLCAITVPLAIACWVLPGTERYWRYWRDNFIKLLLMFPFIVALITAGKIFASVAASSGDGSFFKTIAILMGFFVPLAMLPMTFKWGGSAMAAMGGAINKASSGANKWSNNMGRDRAKLFQNERAKRSQDRVARNVRSWQTPIDKVKSGQWDPTLGWRNSSIRERKVQSYIHAGEESHQKDVEAARSKVLREGQDVRARGGNWDAYFQAVADGKDSYYDENATNDDGTKGRKFDIGKRSEVEQDAARKQLAILGSATNWRYLEDYYESTLGDNAPADIPQKEKEHARKFFDDNVSTIMPKMPHFYQGYTASSDATGDTLAGMHSVEVESIISKYSAEARDNSKTAEERSTAQKRLVTFLQNFQDAAENENITMDNGSLRAVKGFLDSEGGGAFRDEINNPRHPDGRVTRKLRPLDSIDGIDFEPEYREQINKIRTTLAPNIDPVTGTLKRSPESMSATSETPGANRPAPITPVAEYQPTPSGTTAAAPSASIGMNAPSGGGLRQSIVSGSDIEKLSHGVESGVTRANKKTSIPSGAGEVIIEHPAQNIEMHTGESLHPSGVILTPGAQRDLEANPPTASRPNPESPIIMPSSPGWEDPSSKDLPK